MTLPAVVGLLLALTAPNPADAAVKAPYFGVRVIDEATGRGVPLVELRTVNDIPFVSDSAGWVAFHEPGLMDREVYFGVSGPGYEHKKDGFGFRGVRLTTKPGSSVTVKVTRTNIAERITRVTGQGIYRESALLGRAVPLEETKAAVLGQDSVQVVPYKGKLFWLWGDTNLANYPLGNFHTTAATSPLTDKPDEAVRLAYLMDPEHPERVRKMAPFTEPGVVWLFGLLAVMDDTNQEVLLAHFSRRKGLVEELEHGIVRFDDAKGIFVKVATFPKDLKWQFPRNNAVKIGEHYYFAAPYFHTRVRATLADVQNPEKYEAYTFDAKTNTYDWQREQPPTTQADERKLKLERPNYALADAATGKPVLLHTASIDWNEYRKRWVLIGLEMGVKDSPSLLGEVWYAESEQPTGPWHKAIKVASHPKYSYYNPRQHTFFAAEGGRIIYFEGTYTTTFSGNPTPTPRYEYNQLLYRLDLSTERLKAAR